MGYLRRVQVAVLGPVEVRAEGTNVTLSAPKERAVLAYLALRTGSTVSSAELIEALWGEDPPRSAKKAVQTYISQLRKALPSDAIVTAAGGYSLALAAEHFDVRRFESAAATGRRSLAEGDLSGAEQALRDALSQWRGEPFVELTDNAIGASWANQLQETRRNCEEDLVDVRLGSTSDAVLVAELEMAVAAEPLRERRWGQLMLALYRDTRQADALRAYQRLRGILGEELGIEPSPELKRLEAAILAHDSSLDVQRAVRPGPVLDARRQGDRAETVAGSGADPVPASRIPTGAQWSPSVNGDLAEAPVWVGGQRTTRGTARTGRETVTFLFTDLVASTSAFSSVSPDVADQMRRIHFAVLRGALVSHEGMLVKNLGDGIMARFTSPSAALSCAVAMQQAAEHHNRGSANPIGLRVGLSAGEVSLEDEDYFGDPVIEASRLCDRAESGQILLSSVVRLMAGRHASHDYVEVGDLILKGLPEAVTAFDLVWSPLPSGGAVIPLPGRLSSMTAFGFVGRKHERESLVRKVHDLRSGPRRFGLIAGEPGIGKSALMAEVARRLSSGGVTVLYGHCDEDLRLPFQPIVEAVTHYVDHAPDGLLAEHVAVYGGELLRLVPVLHRRVAECPAPTSTDPDAERFLTFNALAGLLEVASRDVAVVLMLDDLHWADDQTLILLRYLATEPRLANVLICGAYRSTDTSQTSELMSIVSSLHREVEGPRIDLAGLTGDEVVELAEAAAGSSLDDASKELAQEVSRETGGNPFFVTEMLRHLVESGTVAQDGDGRWSIETTLEAIGRPQSVREVVTQRVLRLGEQAQRVLSVAAVIGVEFELSVLGTVTGLAEDELLDIVERAEAAALVAETGSVGRFTFSHALVQQTLYDDLSTLRRQRLHRSAAQALEQDADLGAVEDVTALALHWARGGDPERALSFVERAAAASLSALAPDESVRWFREALALQAAHRPDDSALRCDLLVGFGTAQRVAGDPDYRETLLSAGELAGELDDPMRMAGAALAANRGFWSSAGEVDQDKVTALEVALMRLPDDDSPERARLLAMLCNELTFGAPLQRRLELATSAKAMARRLGDPATMIEVLTTIFPAIWVPETLSERLADSALALTLADELGDPMARSHALRCRLRAAIESGAMAEARRYLGRLTTLADEVRLPIFLWVSALAQGVQALVVGDLDEAERVVSEACKIGTESGQPDALVFYVAGMTHVRLQQGRLREYVDQLEEAARAHAGIPGYWGAAALALFDADRGDEAAVLLRDAAADGFAHLPQDSLWLPGLALYSEVAMLLGASEPASILYELLEPWRDQWSYMGAGIDGPVAHFLGGLAAVVGEFDMAEEHFGAAHHAAVEAGATYFTARTELEWARMLVARGRQGDRARAAQLLQQARDASMKYGYGGIIRRSDAELDRLELRS
jgi:DNA-binding SARP family transcriptional activator/class 3 adenylate cyclase